VADCGAGAAGRPVIGLLSPLSAGAASRNVAALRSALRNLGYLEGRNLTLALRYGDGVTESMPSLARELVALNPDVILTGAISGVLAAYNAANGDEAGGCNNRKERQDPQGCLSIAALFALDVTLGRAGSPVPHPGARYYSAVLNYSCRVRESIVNCRATATPVT